MDFIKRLELGIEKENQVMDFLRLSGISVSKYNDEDVTNPDLILHDHKLLIDPKYTQTPFNKAWDYTGIMSKDCVTVSTKHLDKYVSKAKEIGYEPWLAMWIDYKDYEIFELRFVNINKLLEQHSLDVKKKSRRALTSIRDNKLHFHKNIGITTLEFLQYLSTKKQEVT